LSIFKNFTFFKEFIFFPIVNGGLIFLTTIAAVIFFREKLRPRQWVGLALGIAMLAIIAL
jgi:drug/metabolite transporter (DMT)-like permease